MIEATIVVLLLLAYPAVSLWLMWFGPGRRRRPDAEKPRSTYAEGGGWRVVVGQPPWGGDAASRLEELLNSEQAERPDGDS